MTLGEVMALTNEELRIKAAELMGWRAWRKPGLHESRPTVWSHPDDPTSGEGLDLIFLPDFPNDIAAAWELVERMRAVGMWPMVGSPMPLFDDATYEGRWFGESPRGWCVAWNPEMGDQEIYADTAPRAITRAFVLAMSQEAE